MVARAKSSRVSVSGAQSNRIRWFLIASIVVTLALYVIPFGRMIAYPLVLLSTLAHEMGHGLSALAVGAHFNSFHMWSDGSGVAMISGSANRIGQAIIAAGGLLGPSVIAAIFFTAGKKETFARISLTVLGALLIIAEFMYVRNVFGWIFVGIIAAIFLWLAQQRRSWLAQTALVFVAVQLSLSVFSRMDYLFTPTAHTSQGMMPSDVAQIANALFLPYWFWGLICAVLSVLVLFFGVRSFIKK